MAKEKDIAWPIYRLLDALSLSEKNLGLKETLSRDSRDAAGGGGPDGQIALQLAVDVNNSLLLTILILVLVIYLVFAAVLLVKRWWGGRTPLYVIKWPPKSIKTANPYIVTIVTGSRSNSGTDGTLIFSVDGSLASSESYVVKGGSVHFDRKLLTRCAQDCFLIINEEPLGIIQQARVALWATDARDNWYLSYITVLDVRRNVSVYLPFRDWILADAEGGVELTVDASKTDSKGGVFVDNLCVAFIERYIWISAWLSTVLGSKVDSIFSFSLCYLLFVALMFVSVVFFYSGAYGFNDYISGAAFVYLFFLTVLVTAIVGLLQTAMRLIREGGRDFVSRYSPLLLRDLTTPQVRWDGDSVAATSSGDGGDGGGSARRSSAYKARYSYEGDPPAAVDPPEERRSSAAGGGVVERTPSSLGIAGQRNNSALERSEVIRANGMHRRGRGADGDDDDDDTGDRDEQMNNNNRTRSPTNVFPGITPFVKDGQRSTEVKDKFFSSFDFLERTGPLLRNATRTRSSAVFGGGGGGGGGRATRRRYETHLDPPGRPFSGGPRNPHLRLGSGAAEFDRSRNNVAFKCPSKYSDDAKYSAKPTTSELSHSILKKSDDWKTFPFTPQDSTFYAFHGQMGRHHHHHQAGGWYDIGDPLRRFGDPTPKEERAMRTLSESATAASRHPMPVDESADRFFSFRSTPNRSTAKRSAVRQRRTPAPMVSDSFLACDRSAKSCLELFTGGGGGGGGGGRRRGGSRRRSDEVERNWNALWNNVRPRDEETPTNEDPGYDESSASPEGKAKASAAAADLRRFAGKLVENIVRRIKWQLANPVDQGVDLSSCELDIKEFVRKMGTREASWAAEETESRRPPRSHQDAADPGSTPADAFEDSVAKALANGARKNSLSMVEERVATIAGEVEKVMDQILRKMRQELGLDGKMASSHKNSSSPSSSSSDVSRGSPTKADDAVKSLPKDEPLAAEKLTDAKLARVAEASVGSVLSVENLNAIRKKAEEAADDNLKGFASNVVQSLYTAVRTKLEQLLKNEYGDLAGDEESATPFPSEELLRKADHEVKEQVLPTVVEHIVWLMKEEAEAVEQLDCDMMMIAFAGQYVDTIVTNAVLKTNVDLTKKRAYTRTFVVTSNSNKTNNNNNKNNNNDYSDSNNNSNRLDSMVERCLSEEILSISTLASLRASAVQVDDFLGRRHGDAGDVRDPFHQQILFRVLDELIERIRARTGVSLDEETEEEEEEEEEEVCLRCRSETLRSAAVRCLTPLWAKLMVDLVLEEAIGNAERCVDQVRRNTVRCSPEAMLALGCRLYERSRQGPAAAAAAAAAADHLGVVDSVATELRTMAIGGAVDKVAGELMAIGDASRAEAERELRRKVDRFLIEVQKDTEKMAMKAAIRANLPENTQADVNVNYNAATAAPPGDGLKGKRRFSTADELSADIDKPAEKSEEPGDADADSMMDDMIGIRNSLTRIVDEDACLSGRCRLQGGRLSRGLRSSRCDGLHLGDSNCNHVEDPDDRTFNQSLEELEGNTLSDLWNDPRDTRRTTFLVLSHLMLGIAFFLIMTLNVCCVIFGLKLNAVQARLWLGLTFVGLTLHLFIFEPIKVLVLTLYWALARHDLMR